MSASLFKLKQDPFRTARGGYARFLNLYCRQCQHHVLLYQKDGPGPLKRLYHDRILAPDDWTKKIIPIICTHCRELLATPYLYEKEKRTAFLVRENALIKKLSKGSYPPTLQQL